MNPSELWTSCESKLRRLRHTIENERCRVAIRNGQWDLFVAALCEQERYEEETLLHWQVGVSVGSTVTEFAAFRIRFMKIASST